MSTEDALPSTSELWKAVHEQQVRMEEQASRIVHLEAKAAKMDRLEAQLERQRLEKLALASRLAEVEDNPVPSQARVSRAGLLKAAVAGAAGLAAGVALGAPEEAAATSGTMQYGAPNDSDTSTSIIATQPLGGSFTGDSIFTVYPQSQVNGNTTFDGLRGAGCGQGSGVVGMVHGATDLGYNQHVGVYGTGVGVSGAHGVAGHAGDNGRGVTGIGGGTTGAGVVGVGAGTADPPTLNPYGVQGVASLQAGVSGHGQNGQFGVEGISDSSMGVFGSGSYGALFNGTTAPLSLQPNNGAMPPTLVSGSYQEGDIWLGYGHFSTVAWLCTHSGNPGTWVPFMHGNSTDGTTDTLFTKVSTQQYTLSNSDGVTWVDMDGTNLSLAITPKQNALAIISGNSDLWTSQAGYNQDLGIGVSGGAYPTTAGQPEAWKESGGFAGTFSPNAAFVQTVLPLAAGTAYTIKLQWKANKNASGATIWAGAGPIGGKFSPTRLTVLLIPTA